MREKEGDREQLPLHMRIWEMSMCVSVIYVVMFDMVIWLWIMIHVWNAWVFVDYTLLVFGTKLLKIVVLTKATRTFPNDIYIPNSCHFVCCNVYTIMCPNACRMTIQYMHWVHIFPYRRHSNCRCRWHHTHAIVDNFTPSSHTISIRDIFPHFTRLWMRHHLGLSTRKWVNRGICSILDFRNAHEWHTEDKELSASSKACT